MAYKVSGETKIRTFTFVQLLLCLKKHHKGIEKSKDIPFENVLFALGIRFVGETVAKKLAKHYKNIDALMQASLNDLILVDEIGEKIAQSVIEFFENQENRIIIERLKHFKKYMNSISHGFSLHIFLVSLSL